MKKIMAMVLVVMLIMSIGVSAFAYYETEEVPVELINRLLDEDFARDEDDSNVWYYKYNGMHTEEEHPYIAYGDFDVYLNVGHCSEIVFDDDMATILRACVFTVRWNQLDEDFEIFGE